MERPEQSIEFEQAWRSIIPEGRKIPSMEGFTPATFKDFLPLIMLSEVNVEEQSHKIRLAGDKIREAIGFDLKGRNINSLIAHDDEEGAFNRQARYHDQPVGRYAYQSIQLNDDTALCFHATQFPMWGTKNERVVIHLFIPDQVKNTLGLTNVELRTREIVKDIWIEI